MKAKLFLAIGAIVLALCYTAIARPIGYAEWADEKPMTDLIELTGGWVLMLALCGVVNLHYLTNAPKKGLAKAARVMQLISLVIGASGGAILFTLMFLTKDMKSYEAYRFTLVWFLLAIVVTSLFAGIFRLFSFVTFSLRFYFRKEAL